MAKYGTGLDLNSICKTEAPELLKHFFVEIRKTKKDDEGKEYEPGSKLWIASRFVQYRFFA